MSLDRRNGCAYIEIMESGLKDVISNGDRETLRALLYACAATESENIDDWHRMCPHPDTCPLAPAVKADAWHRDAIIDSYTDEEVVQLLSTHFECYEQFERSGVEQIPQ
jgi:uncharacterized linocin/CFP29 family protein